MSILAILFATLLAGSGALKLPVSEGSGGGPTSAPQATSVVGGGVSVDFVYGGGPTSASRAATAPVIGGGMSVDEAYGGGPTI
jgi:hypothetical protein